MKKIKLDDGLYATIDDEDYETVLLFEQLVGEPWKVFGRTSNKAVVMAGGNFLHRIIMRVKKGRCVKHLNGDGLDNRKENLLECSLSYAKSTQKGVMKNNRSGFRGVSDNGPAYRKKWRAELNYEGQRYRLGNYYDKQDAARTYDKKALELFGEDAQLNFPELREQYLLENEIDYERCID